MASTIIRNSLKSIDSITLRTLACYRRTFSIAAANTGDESDAFSFSSDTKDSAIHLKLPKKETASSSVTMPMSFMTGSIVGKRFYNKVTTREADDGNGWSVMLDYRTLKTPSKRALKLPTVYLAKAIAAEWDYQVTFSLSSFGFNLDLLLIYKKKLTGRF
ncbi:ATP synthase mitochondrial F1 complex assembly factor 2 [Bienertia sinuspersici]